MTDKELDDLFKNAFAEHQVPVPPDMWARVNPQKDKRRRAAFFWWSGLGVAAFFVIVVTATWLHYTSSQKEIISEKAIEIKEKNQASEKQRKVESGKEKKASSNSTDDLSFKTKQVNTASRNREQYDGTAAFQSEKNDRQKLNKAAIDEDETRKRNNDISLNKNPASEVAASQNHELTDATSSSNASVIPDSANHRVITSLQKPNSVTNNPAKQEAKAAAVKVKKIHSEKAASLELMIAGYGNDRHVYGTAQSNAAALVTFGALDSKEKSLMRSFSINARIDKPVSAHISFKTGLQFCKPTSA